MRESTSPRTTMIHSGSKAVLKMVIVSFVFLCGALLGSRYPHWVAALPVFTADSAPAEAGAASSLPAVEPAEGDAESTAAGLLKELAAQRSLQGQRDEELRREVREAEVALHLLRVRGYAADDAVCREQAAKARTGGAALARLREQCAETMRLETELRQAHEEDRARHDRPSAEPGVGSRVRIYLTRRSLMRQVALPVMTESKGPCRDAITDP